MYRLLRYVLCALLGTTMLLSAAGSLPYETRDIALQAIFFVGLCWGINSAIARLLHITPRAESSIITGLILATIVGPLSLPNEWLALTAIGIATIASKYLIVIHKRHIFNPAAFGITTSAVLFGYPASWWIGSTIMFPFILAGGFLIILKMRRFHLVASFLGAYFCLLALEAFFFAAGNF